MRPGRGAEGLLTGDYFLTAGVAGAAGAAGVAGVVAAAGLAASAGVAGVAGVAAALVSALAVLCLALVLASAFTAPFDSSAFTAGLAAGAEQRKLNSLL